MPTVRITLLTFLFAKICLTIQAQSPYTELKTNEIIFVKWFLSNYERLNDLETLQKEAISLGSIFDKTNTDRIGIMSNDSAYFLSVISRKSEFSFPADWCKEINTLSQNKIERLDRKKKNLSPALLNFLHYHDQFSSKIKMNIGSTSNGMDWVTTEVLK